MAEPPDSSRLPITSSPIRANSQQLAQDADGIVFAVHSLYAHFLRVVDRRGRRGRRYELGLILTALALAKMAGEDTPSGIADWARARQTLFSATFSLKRATMPGHNTYRRTLQRGLCLADLDREICAYLAAWPEVGHEVHISLDGKTVRGTIAFGETRGLHLLAAYVYSLGGGEPALPPESATAAASEPTPALTAAPKTPTPK